MRAAFGVDQLDVDLDLIIGLSHTAFDDIANTELPEIRERSVVRSPVIPSAKYSCSGSLDKLAKGRTTNDKRGAGVLATVDGTCGFATAGAWTATVGGFPLGQAHQATIAMPITERTPAAI